MEPKGGQRASSIAAKEGQSGTSRMQPGGEGTTSNSVLLFNLRGQCLQKCSHYPVVSVEDATVGRIKTYF